MTTAEELLKDVEKKDLHFRWARAIFIALLLIVPVVGAAIGYNTLQSSQQILKKVQAQQAQLNAAVQELKTNTDTGLKRANDHIDCIALFFTQPNRINKTLSPDLGQSCNILTMPTSLAPQVAPSVNSKPVTVVPNSPTPSVVRSSQPQAKPAPKQTGIQKAITAVQGIINNLARSL